MTGLLGNSTLAGALRYLGGPPNQYLANRGLNTDAHFTSKAVLSRHKFDRLIFQRPCGRLALPEQLDNPAEISLKREIGIISTVYFSRGPAGCLEKWSQLKKPGHEDRAIQGEVGVRPISAGMFGSVQRRPVK
jgi:hypothetical protein